MIEHIPHNELLGVIKEIEASPSITQRTLSEKLGISLGKTNYILRALAEKGIIKLKRFKNAKNKRAYLYILTPVGIINKVELTRNFLERKIKEYEQLKDEISDLRRGLSLMARADSSVSGKNTGRNEQI